MAVRHWQLAGFVMAYIVLSAPAVLAEAGPYETVLTREMLKNVRNAPDWENIPDSIRVRYSACFAASVIDGMAMDEVRQLNAAAQGLRLNEELAQRAVDQLKGILAKLKNRDLSVLEKVCPADIANFRKNGL